MKNFSYVASWKCLSTSLSLQDFISSPHYTCTCTAIATRADSKWLCTANWEVLLWLVAEDLGDDEGQLVALIQQGLMQTLFRALLILLPLHYLHQNHIPLLSDEWPALLDSVIAT
jgi:hypothetical protein